MMMSRQVVRDDVDRALGRLAGDALGYVLGATSHASGDVVIAVAVVQQKQHSGAARFGGAPRLRPGHGRELGTFSAGEESTHVSQTRCFTSSPGVTAAEYCK
jgi:hypothetical protein